MEFQAMPEDCIAEVLSHITPVDLFRLSVASKNFYSAAEWDTMWDRFLPSDIKSIISRSDSESAALADSPSKKALYLALSDHPIIIDHASKSFQLERKSGKKCYMLASRALVIVWGETPQYWNWAVMPAAMPESRFPQVAELRNVCWLEIRGVINTNALSPNTQYAAYLVFNMINPDGFHNCPVRLSVDILGGLSSTKNVCLDPNVHEGMGHNGVAGLQRPTARTDGWLEIEMGEFFSSDHEDLEVQLSVMGIEGLRWKRGLFIEGIQLRPKEAI